MKKKADLNNYLGTFLFHKCCKVLERVSIWETKDMDGALVPQNTLIKFIWNTHYTLKWFQSYLSVKLKNILSCGNQKDTESNC